MAASRIIYQVLVYYEDYDLNPYAWHEDDQEAGFWLIFNPIQIAGYMLSWKGYGGQGKVWPYPRELMQIEWEDDFLLLFHSKQID